MSNPSMTMLDLGYLDCQYFRIVDGDDHQRRYHSPVSATLIQHPDLGNVLFDTGNSPYSRWEYGDHVNEVYPVGRFVSIEEALGSRGLSCSDIDMIVLSHLHFDHVGGLRYFTGTRAIRNVVVSRPELDNACRSVFTGEPGSAYVKSLFDVDGVRFRTITETTELAEGITLFIQHAHTPGLIGLVLQTRTAGNVIMTSDSVYTRESWESLTPPGGGINKTTDEFFSNIEMLKGLQERYDATMIFGHDSEQVREWSRRGRVE